MSACVSTCVFVLTNATCSLCLHSYKGHTGQYLTPINERGSLGGGGERKSVRKAGYLLSLTEGFPGEGSGEGCGGERPGFIEKKHRLFGIGRKQTIICID